MNQDTYSNGVEYSTSEYEYEYRKKLRLRVLILKNVLEYKYRKKVRVRVRLLLQVKKKNFLVVTAQNLSQKHTRIRFFSVSGMLRRRTTAGDNFLLSYTQNYFYILNKLGTLTLKARARFFARRK